MRWIVLILMSLVPLYSCGQDLKGEVVDERLNAIPFANVALYSEDSMFVAGTVTDEAGAFELNDTTAKRGYLKVSCVGYAARELPLSDSGYYRIVLSQDKVVLGEVVVKGHLPRYARVRGGYEVNIKNSVLERLFCADDILGSLPHVTGKDGNFLVFGKGKPEIYLNSRKLRDASELAHLKPADIEKVTVLTNPGVKYGSEVKAVIIIKTRRKQGEGLSGSVDGKYGQKHKASYDADVSLNWRADKWDVFGSLEHSNTFATDQQTVEQTIQGHNHLVDEDLSGMLRERRYKKMIGRLGADWWVNDSNSMGVTYHFYDDLPSQYMRTHYVDELYLDSEPQDHIDYMTQATPDNGPTHEIDGYYSGKIKNFNIAFDGTYYHSRQRLHAFTSERGSTDDISVTSAKKAKSELLAAKLVVSTAITKRLSLDFGAEYSFSDFHQSYGNKEGIISPTRNRIKENNVAGFLSADYAIGDFGLSAGLRYEHTNNRKYENGTKQGDVSRIYNKVYPNVDLSYSGEDFNVGLSYEMTSEKPSYGDLSSVVAYNSKYFYEGGNPNLDMTIEHCLELSASYRYFSLLCSYEVDKNAITRWGRLYNDHDDIILLTNINIPTQKLLYLSFSAEPSFGFWHPMVEIDWQKQFVDRRDLDRDFNRPITQFIFNNRFLLKHTMIGVNYTLRSAGADGYAFAKRYQVFSAYVAQTFLKGRLQVKLQLDDPFKSSKSINEMYATDYHIKQTLYPSYRSLMLSVSYHFNKTRKRYMGTGAGTGEKGRL